MWRKIFWPLFRIKLIFCILMAVSASTWAEVSSNYVSPVTSEPIAVAQLRRSILDGPYAKTPIREVFNRHMKTVGPNRQPVVLALLVRKQETLPLLVDILESGSEEERFGVLLFLQKVGRWKEASPQVLAILKNSEVNWELRLRAAATAAILQIREARELIIDLLENSDKEGTRVVCSYALGELGGAGATDSLFIALSDPSARVRISSAGALGKLGNNAGLNVLLSLSRDDHWAIRERVAKALGFLRINEAKMMLHQMESDDVVNVRSAAKIGLLRIEIRSMKQNDRNEKLSSLLSHRNRKIASWAAKVLVDDYGAAATVPFGQVYPHLKPSMRKQLEYLMLRLGQEVK